MVDYLIFDIINFKKLSQSPDCQLLNLTSRSRRRLSGMDFDAACDRAKEKMADCSRYEKNHSGSDNY